MHLFSSNWGHCLGPYQGSFGSGYMDLMNKFNKILETDPRLDDDGKVMKFGPGY